MMLPPVSPYSLIQEGLWPDEWKCLVVCVMLNCTTRKQVEKILPEFFRRWPDAASTATADAVEMSKLISPLGFGNRRTTRLIDLAREYNKRQWTHVEELPGIGKYASRMWEMFFLGKLGDEAPEDGSLALYWWWLKNKGASLETPSMTYMSVS